MEYQLNFDDTEREVGIYKTLQLSALRLCQPVLAMRLTCRLACAFLLINACLLRTATAQDAQFAPPAITPEGKFLELIDLEEEPPKQLVLMDLFIQQFPKYDGIAALYGDMQPLLVQLKQYDRALDIGAKLLAIDENNVEAVKNNILAAEGKKDDGLVKKWKDRLAVLTAEPKDTITATSTVNTPYVEGGGSGEALSGAVPALADIQAMPKHAQARLEAALFNRAIQETDPAAKVAVLDQFVKAFPQSQHLTKANYLYFAAYRLAGDDKRALTVAEQILQHDQSHEDVLAFVANSYFRQKREFDKLIAYSSMMLDLINAGPKPEGVSDDDWAKEREISRFQAHYMIGMVHVWREQWSAAEKELRTALSLRPGQDQLSAAILTSLGWANYKMRNVPEAIKLYEQCSRIAGPFQHPAEQSIISIKSEFGLQ